MVDQWSGGILFGRGRSNHRAMRGSSVASMPAHRNHNTDSASVVCQASSENPSSLSAWKNGVTIRYWMAGATAMQNANPVVAPKAARSRYARGVR